ncbi:hypothetical protein Pmani_019321 [Petrolisthes manimaculis]|uniref:Uncharacterized protein n=1 Tax=Petrolisthes manimaculis TaxID=1843537 RepID=A0AAE1U3P2_9EUCA|nr:hypothetical protein Pmani_019321 [Petrolisthes manimaculis]
MASLVVLQMLLVLLVTSVVCEEWQPCQPYQPNQINHTNFTAWLGPSHSTSLALQVQQLPWSANFTIMGKHFGLYQHSTEEDMMVMKFDDTQQSCPVQAFPINKWTTITFTRKEHVIEADILAEQQTFSISSRLPEECQEAEIKNITLTSARLSLECPGECVGQEADEKHLQDNSHTFFLLPMNDCLISMTIKLKNCSETSLQQSNELSQTCQDMGLHMNIWNKVTVTYKNMDGFDEHSLEVNDQKFSINITDGPNPDCHDLLEYVVKVEGSVLWSGEGCEGNLYLNKTRKEHVKNGCTNTTTNTTNVPPTGHKLLVVKAEEEVNEEYGSATNTTSPPSSSQADKTQRPFMSTIALVFLVIIALIIVIVVIRVIWRAVARRRQGDNSVNYYSLRIQE